MLIRVKLAIALANPFCCSDSDEIKPLAMLAISDKIVSDHTSDFGTPMLKSMPRIVAMKILFCLMHIYILIVMA